MAKFFGFEIDSKRLLASALATLTFGAAAAQDQAPAENDDATNVIATGYIARPGQKLGPEIIVYADRKVTFKNGTPVPEGIYSSVIGKVNKEVLLRSGLGTGAIRNASNSLTGLAFVQLNRRGEVIHVENDFTLPQFEAVAASAMEANPAFAASTLKARTHKTTKHIVAKARPQVRAEAPKTEEVVSPVTPVVGADAANFAPAPFAWEPTKPAIYDFNALPASAPVASAPITTKETSVPAPMAQDTWSAWQQNVKDRFAQLGRLITGAVGLIGTLGLAAAFTSGRKQTVAGTQRLTSSRPVEGAGDEELATSKLLKVDVDGDNPNLPKYSTVAAAFGRNSEEWVEERDSGLLAGDRGQPAIEGQCERITQASPTAAPVEAKDTGYNGEDSWPPSIPNLIEVAPLTAAITNAYNGDLASKLSAPVVNQDRGRQTDITRDEDGTIHIALSNNRLRLEIAANEDGTYAVKAAGAGLGRGKAPVEATLGVDGKLVIDQETLAARMSAKQTKGKGIDAEFAKAAFETFGAKAETVIMRALNRAVAVIQAAPEAPAAVVRYGHRTPTVVRSSRTLALQT